MQVDNVPAVYHNFHVAAFLSRALFSLDSSAEHRVGSFERVCEKWNLCKTGFRKAYKQVFLKDIAVSSLRSVAQPVPQRKPKRATRKLPAHMP